MRVGHAFGRPDGVAFDKAVDDLGPAGEVDAVHLRGLAIDGVCTIIDKLASVNGGAYMDFKEATDSLFNGLDHARLAKQLGVSVATVRQARLKPTAGAHRSPPPGWKEGVAKLAADQLAHYRWLLESLDASTFALDNYARYEGDKDANRFAELTHCDINQKPGRHSDEPHDSATK